LPNNTDLTTSTTSEGEYQNKWVLYIDLLGGQCSFHSPERYKGPDYPGEWDGKRLSGERIIKFCQEVFDGCPA
jgi:hypothetical protein